MNRIRLWEALEVGAPQFWLNVCRHLQKRQLGEEVSSDFGVLAWRKGEMDSWVAQTFPPHWPSVWWEASWSSQPHLLTPQWTNFDLRQYFHHKQIFSETWYQTWNYLIDTLYNPCWVTKFQIWWKCWFLMTLLCG